MGEAKHTPGPWVVERIRLGKYAGSFGVYPAALEAGTMRATGPAFAILLGGGRDDVREANARLIGAAPETVETLYRAFIAFGRAGGNTIDGPFRKEWEECRAALAKAGVS